MMDKIIFEGKTFEIIERNYRHNNKNFSVEIASRSPGVRIVLVKNNKILLIKEFRFELSDYDYRLPGGKVFDTLKEYKNKIKNKKNVLNFATEAAKKEFLEETGLILKNIKHLCISKAGLTVEWDLYYFVASDFKKNTTGQKLKKGEIIYSECKTFDEVTNLCINNEIREDRTIGILLKFLLKHTQ